MSTIELPTREDFLEQLSPYPVECCSTIDEDASTCIICVRELVDIPVNNEKERAVLPHDTHAFGEECAREWLATANTCPKCRTVLYQQDDDNDDAAVEHTEPIEPTFDAEELSHLMWRASELSRRDPRTEAFSDHEVMGLYFDLWNQWIMATEEDVNDTWSINGPKSNEVAAALRELLQVRYRWWRHSPEQFNLNVTQAFNYPAGSWMPTERDLRHRVVIDFGMNTDLNIHLMGLTAKVLTHAFDGNDNCILVSGHPAALALHDRFDGVLQNYEGQRITVSFLREKLREWVGDADQMELDGVNPHLPPNYTHFVRYLIDKVVQRAIRRTRRAREARRAQRQRARPVSRAPRMSVGRWSV
jgi:hypothetical protein